MEKILVSAYNVFVGRADYDNAYVALRKLWKDSAGIKEDRATVYGLIKEFRSLIAHVDNKDVRAIYKRTYLLTARDVFDDFMIYIEWNRPIAQQYWLPRRKKLKEVCDALQSMEDDELDELFISLPPRVGKTTLVLFFMLWIILRDSERSNLYCSYSDGVTTVFYKGLLEILTDPYTYGWQDVFPECKIASTNAKDLLLNIGRDKRYASFTARSVSGSLNGSCDCKGYSVADDLVSGIEEAMNKERLLSLWSKVENNYIPRGVGDKVKHLWIGTRWSLVDPQGLRMELLENEPKFKSIRWKVISVPALDKNDESNFDYACGVGFTTEQYQQRRASFERNNDMPSWNAQYQNAPVERTGTIFLPEDLRFFNGVLPEGEPDEVLFVIDPAWGGGDYCSGPIVYRYGDDLFVPDVIFSDLEKRFTQPEIVHKAKKWGVQAMYVEATKMTAEYADGIDDELRAQGYRVNMQKSVKHFTGTGKGQRIINKAAEIREHMIFLAEGHRSKEYELFMQNLYAFSYSGRTKHDDAPDSCAMTVSVVFSSTPEAQILDRRRFGI